MTRLLLSILLASLLEPVSASQTGYAARYRAGLMERAATVHGVDIPPGRKLCASPHHPLRTLLTVTSRVRGREGRTWRCVVVDVAHERDRAAIVRRGIVIELPPVGAMLLCGTVQEPPRQCPVTVE